MKKARPYMVSTDRQRAAVVERLYELPMPFYVTVQQAGKKRSIAQNSLLWLWNSQIQKHMAEHYGQHASAEEWHEVLVEKLCPVEQRVVKTPDGEKHIIGRARTSRMNVSEMTEYLSMLEMYCAETLNLQLPRPEDLYWSAIMEQSNAA